MELWFIFFFTFVSVLQIIWYSFGSDKSGKVIGWFWGPRKRRCISSQTCSIGDKSGDIAGQGRTLTFFWIKKSVTTSATSGRALSCCSVALCCCTNGRTWGCMISSRYLMPVSVPSTTTRAVLPRDEIPPHTMTLSSPKGRRWITSCHGNVHQHDGTL